MKATELPSAERRSVPLLDLHRRTWEIELLISGALVFTLLRVPTWADHVYHRLDFQFSKELGLLPFSAFYATKLVAYVLIIAFVSHLLGRAYWVGLIGLDAAFPRGIDWSKTGMGPLSKAFYRKHLPDRETLIRRTDRFCSSIFSVCFFFLILLGYMFGLLFVISPVAVAIDRLAFSGKFFPAVLVGVLYAFLIPMALVGVLDKVARRKWPRLARSRFFRRGVGGTLKLFYVLSPTGLLLPIQFTFISHFSKKLINAFVAVAFVVLAVLFLGNLVLGGGIIRFDSYQYFHDDMGELGVDAKFYEDQRTQGEIHRHSPSIPSDVVREPYVKLFIPYSPRYNQDLARACPDVRPLQREGFSSARTTVDEGDRAAALACLASLFRLRLDGQPLDDAEFFFYRHPETNVRGIVTYLDTEGLARGRHLLELERRQDDADVPEHRRKYSIPFWT